MPRFKQTALAAIVCTAGLFAAHPAFCYSLNFTMVDDTDQPITAMWTSLSSSDYWMPTSNVFVAESGGSQTVDFDRGAYGDNCDYDIKVEFADGEVRVLSGVNLCHVSAIELNVNDAGNVTYNTYG